MTRQQFRDVMTERRQWPRGSMDWKYLTRTARTYLAMLRGVPAKHLGLKPKTQKIPGSKGTGLRKRMDGTVVRIKE